MAELQLSNSGACTVAGVETGADVLTADCYVATLGSYSPALLRLLGMKLPVYPVKGYTITVPVARPEAVPVSTVMDETFKVAITRLGDRIRVGGTAELAGFSLRLRRCMREHSVRDLFPDGGDVELDRASAHDVRRHADGRTHAACRPVYQNRAWHARLDHVVRLRSCAGRSHLLPGLRP